MITNITAYTPLKGKQPLLVLGAHYFTRQHCNAVLLQNWDLHFLFLPRAEAFYTVGIAMFSRTKQNEAPRYVYAEDEDPISASLQVLRYAEEISKLSSVECNPTLVRWHTHWIYRLPKIILKELHSMQVFVENTKEGAE